MKPGFARVRPLALFFALALGVPLILPSAAHAARAPEGAVSALRKAASPGRVELPSEAPSLDVPNEVSDQEVQATLERVFGEVKHFKSVTVEVKNGVVHLGGATATTEAQERAEALARRMPGVLFVDSAIESESDVGERLDPVLSRIERAGRHLGARIPVLGVALLVMVFAVTVARLIRRCRWPFEWVAGTDLMQGILRMVASGTVLVLGLLLAVELLDATALVGALLGALGVFGISLGLGSRDIFENYIATLVLAVRHPFAIDDLVRIGEHEGKVARLTSRETVLLSLDGNHLRLPNAHVFKSVVVNYTENPLRSFSFSLVVGTEEDLGRAQRVAAAGVRRVAGVLLEPAPACRVDEIEPSGVRLKVFGWVDQRESDWFATRSEALRAVKHAFDEAGIVLSAPSLEIDLRRERTHEQLRAAVAEAPANAPIEREIAEQIHAERRNQPRDLLRRPVERA